MRAVRSFWPELEQTEPVELWRGFRPCSADGLPLIGRAGRYRNLTVATGHGMAGVSLAPITAALVTEIVAGHEPSMDLAPLRIDRHA